MEIYVGYLVFCCLGIRRMSIRGSASCVRFWLLNQTQIDNKNNKQNVIDTVYLQRDIELEKPEYLCYF